MKPSKNGLTFTKKIKEGGLPGMYDVKKIWNPTWFQGNRKQSGYFEGWYFKVVSHEGKQSWAFIPGISLSKGDDHSFVQVINGKTGNSWYYRFPLDAFSYSKEGFHVQIANNNFSSKHMTLDLDSDQGRFQGNFSFSGNHVYRTKLHRPGIMGWYRYVPFMECYHGVVSLDHHVEGKLQTGDQMISFSGGKGYIEKDWGSSMPKAWLWMQSNHFNSHGTSFMLSVARIPWIGNAFTGFLGFFLFQGKRYDFATYTGAKLNMKIEESGSVQISITGKNFHLSVSSQQGKAGSLKAPVSGNMQRVIHESIDATIHIQLVDAKGNTLFTGTGANAGLELVGDHQLLL